MKLNILQTPVFMFVPISTTLNSITRMGFTIRPLRDCTG
nr:MAG TPA: hypothetical protein [Caudoviricetes sp.]